MIYSHHLNKHVRYSIDLMHFFLISNNHNKPTKLIVCGAHNCGILILDLKWQ